MVSANTFHVVATELVVGAYSLAGIAFLFCLLCPWLPTSIKEKRSAGDAVAHSALMFGIIATPFAIWSGLSSAPSGDMGSPLLANKMLLSMSGLGLALGTLVGRWRGGAAVWETRRSSIIQACSGAGATGLMLLTASAGGTFSRGESLLDWLHLPYNEVMLMPTYLSVVLLLLGLACTVVGFKPTD
jgi:hypothetical protein|tara:strand:- start:7240 stop:7797 length:558 start_codon:yes stop_codon:yes gene_type:complete